MSFTLFFPVYVPSPISISHLIATRTTPHTDSHSTTGGDSLGLGDEQRVGEEEEMSLLGLQARLQLGLGVTQEETAGILGQEGLDEGTWLRADGCQAALPAGQEQGQDATELDSDEDVL